MRIQGTKWPDQNWRDAGKLMKERNIPAEQHEILQENVATYLSHRSSGKLSDRWQAKVDRELAKPFSDDQVGPRIDALQTSLHKIIHELPSFPSQVYLTGSFSRGRLGANSDLDGYAALKPEDVSKGFDSYEKYVETSDACLFPMSEKSPGFNRANLMYAGASVEIDPKRLGESGYLRKVYTCVQEARTQRRETSTPYEWATGKMWGEGLSAQGKREQFEGKTLKSRIMNNILSLGGTLAAVPFVGAVVRKVADLCVHQTHLEKPQV